MTDILQRARAWLKRYNSTGTEVTLVRDLLAEVERLAAERDALQKDVLRLAADSDFVGRRSNQIDDELGVTKVRLAEVEREKMGLAVQVERLGLGLGRAEAERDAARADAERLAEYIRRTTAGLSPTDWDSLEERAEVEGLLAAHRKLVGE